MFSRVFSLSTAPRPWNKFLPLSVRFLPVARNGHLEILYPIYRHHNASESAPFNSKKTRPIVADRGQYPACYTVQSLGCFFFQSLLFLSLSLSLREEGNTIDYNNKSGYFESSPLSRIHLVVTRRFFRGADGKLPPFTSETKKGGEEKWIRV